MINTDQGYTHLNTFTVTLNMPIIANRTYQYVHTRLFHCPHKTGLKRMMQTSKEERLSIERNNVNQCCHAKIAAIAHDTWNSKLYTINFNDLSDVINNILNMPSSK